MAVNHRGRLGVIPSENGQTRNYVAAKSVAAGPPKTRRAALGDINNILNSNATTGKIPSAAESVKPTLIKKTVTTVTVTHRETKKVVVTSSKPVDAHKAVHKDVAIKKPAEIKVEKLQEPKEVKSYSSQRLEIIEATENGDPQLVAEYVNEILAYLRALELRYDIDEHFLACHKTTTRMRTVLVNWLVEVHMNFHMLPETLHLCIAIIDRYLQKNKMVGRDNLQLVGVTALFVAGKYEEMYIPELGDFVYVCDDSFSKQQILTMELSIMKTLDFNFGRPFSLHFLRRLSKVAKVQPQQHNLAKYILELCLLWDELSYIRPSLQAAAAICLSLSVLSDALVSPADVWTKTLVHYSTYDYSHIDAIVRLMAAVIVKAQTSKYDAVHKKYTSSAYSKVSQCPELKGPVIKKLTQKKPTSTSVHGH